MKISWPWRRNKPLSLFENRISRTKLLPAVFEFLQH